MRSKEDKKTVVVEQSYTIKMIYFSDGSSCLQRKCDGFNAYELLGLLSLIQMEIHSQIEGKIKPTEIKRELIKNSAKEARKKINSISKQWKH